MAGFAAPGSNRFGSHVTHRSLSSLYAGLGTGGAEQCVPYRRSINEDDPTRCESLRGLFEAMSWQQMIASNARREPVELIELGTDRRRRATTSDGIVTCLLRIQPRPAPPDPRPMAKALARWFNLVPDFRCLDHLERATSAGPRSNEAYAISHADAAVNSRSAIS